MVWKQCHIHNPYISRRKYTKKYWNHQTFGGKKAVFLPNLTHSYILELKYMPKKDYTEEAAEKQWQEAVEQINSYAVAPRVEALRQGTQMHKIDHHSNGVIYRGK